MTFASNPYDLLEGDENEDLQNLVRAARVKTEKKGEKIVAPATESKGPAGKPQDSGRNDVRGRNDRVARGGGRGRGGRGNDQNGFDASAGENQAPRGAAGGGRGRGRGGGRGDGRSTRREYERRDATGRGHETEKRGGAGKGNWGTEADEIKGAVEESKPEAHAPEEPAPAEAENAEAQAAEAEAEAKEKSLEEYEKELAGKKAALNRINTAAKSVSMDEFKGMKVVKKPVEEEAVPGLELSNRKKDQKKEEKKEEKSKKQPLQLQPNFSIAEPAVMRGGGRGRRDGGREGGRDGGRGGGRGRGTGRGRGEGRGEGRGRGGGVAINYTDESAFPSLG